MTRTSQELSRVVGPLSFNDTLKELKPAIIPADFFLKCHSFHSWSIIPPDAYFEDPVFGLHLSPKNSFPISFPVFHYVYFSRTKQEKPAIRRSFKKLFIDTESC